ncbi:uncharacterized protein K460DRAFT_370715 [Cucurbitaria berberidis CBS 394.84]|uniref:Polyketide synthase n=1 Tax=Cucurbitaria berberidis CBS 394.84 TaxID=1168544 RepID=A0A9P4L3B9_9PLEO|nr:uncharacterized protein K460DRAFT_370715 [Cucurbitaria berberidis CBS 394.84]KAF1840756.1 hypothetical protein K460DRAFT_370715 [Cucurbitaria berberidis CBS 394.84]
MALVGGTNMILSPDQMIPMSYMGFCNSDGRSYSFDDRGSGYGRGEGAATLVLKRLSDAISAGDPIRSIIKHSAINQDGRTVGITTPSQSAQENLARSLLDTSGIDPASIDFIEAHGTGTQVGDLTELQAIANVFCQGQRNRPLTIGSCKANIGHLEAASGVAGVVKCVLALEKGELPPQPNFEVPKPGLRLDQWGLEVPRQKRPWPHFGTRRAIVNSFGYGGTNCMTLLESVPAWLQSSRVAINLPRQINVPSHSIEWLSEHPGSSDGAHGDHDILLTPAICIQTSDGNSDDGSSLSLDASSPYTSHYSSVAGDEAVSEAGGARYLFVLSAKSMASLAQHKHQLKRWLQSQRHRPHLLSDLAFTLGSRRTRHLYRRCFAVSSRKEVLAALDEETDATSTTVIPCRIAFVFTGQGAQWHAMGRELLFNETKFATSIRTSDRMLRTLGAEWSLTHELAQSKATSRIHQAEIGQPACTAVQIAIVDMLQHWGVAPSTVIGHSSGEIAAAYAVGALSHEDALRVSFHRGSLSRLSRSRLGNGNGAMLAVGMGEAEASEVLSTLQAGRVVVACANSPSSTTLSGDEPAIDEVRVLLDRKGISARKLRVDTAYHSHHMEAVSSDYVKLMQQVEERKPLPAIRYISSVTANEKHDGFGPEYWAENLVSRVRFADAVQTLVHAEVPTGGRLLFVEIGPHSVLGAPLREILQDQSLRLPFTFQYITSLVRDKHADATLLDTAAQLCANGVDINVRNVNTTSDTQHQPHVITDLAPYPWDHSTSYWHEPRISREYRFRKHAHHELLGVRDVSTPHHVPSWRSFISRQTLPWLKDHVVQGLNVFPGAGFLCMVMEAVLQLADSPHPITGFHARRVDFLEALMLTDDSQRVEMHTNLRLQPHASEPRYEFVVSSYGSDNTWQQNCTGTIEPIFASQASEHDTKEQLAKARTSCANWINGDELYAQLRKRGNNYGNTFALLHTMFIGKNIGVGCTEKVRSSLSSTESLSPYTIHPTLLDAIFHSVMPLQWSTHPQESCLILQSIDDMIVSCTDGVDSDELTLLTEIPSVSSSVGGCNVLAVQEQSDGNTLAVAEVSGIAFHYAVPRFSDTEIQSASDVVYELRWDTDVDLAPGTTLESLVKTTGEAQSDYSLHKEGYFAEASVFYIHRCLQQLEESKSKVSQLHYEHLVAWMHRFMRSMAAEKHLSALDGSDPARYSNLPQLGILGEALKRNGEALYDILLGRIDPLAHLLEDNLLYRLYNEDSFRGCNEYLRTYLAPLIFKDPNMNVLEIGAGTGSTAIPLFNQLSPNGERIFNRYDFTDISPGFFENGREKLSSWREMVSFRVFNLDVDAEKQGFQGGDYDLVIAANVVHATKSINDTLRSIRRLLKPTGKIMLIEIVESVPMLNIMFGVLEGWWAGIDEGRTDTPLRSINQWRDHFSACGFGHIQAATNDFHALMLADAVPQPPQQPEVQIVNYDPAQHSEFDHAIRESLEEKNFTVTTLNQANMPIDEDKLYLVIDGEQGSSLLREGSFRQMCNMITHAACILWIVLPSAPELRDSYAGTVTGFARVARSENSRLRLVTIDIQDDPTLNVQAVVSSVLRIASSMLSQVTGSRIVDMDYVFRKGAVHIPRLLHSSDILKYNDTARSRKLTLSTSAFEDVALQPDEIVFDVKAFGMEATGLSADHNTSMSGCSGLVTAVGTDLASTFEVGDEVYAHETTSIASKVRVKGSLAVKLPSSSNLSAGVSSIPPFATAYYSLIEIARLRHGQSALIHDAENLVGKAAVQLCQHLGVDVIATVNSNEERDQIATSSGISRTRILLLSSSRFKHDVLRLTGKGGIDVVLSYENLDVREKTLECLAPMATYVEIKMEMPGNPRRPVFFPRGNLSLHVVDLRALATHRPGLLLNVLRSVVDLMATNVLKPLNVPVLPVGSVDLATFPAESRARVGRVVFEIENTETIAATPPPSHLEGGTFVIAGGLGSFGQQLCSYLAMRGVKHMAILTRRNLAPDQHEALQKSLGGQEARVKILQCDICEMANVEWAIAQITASMPPIRAVVQAAMLLKACAIERMTFEDFAMTMRPKTTGTQNLIQALQEVRLDTFLMLSSCVTVVGGEGQASYSAGNGCLDSIAQNPPQSGTRFISLSLGMVDGTKHTSDMSSRRKLARQGVGVVSVDKALQLIDYALSPQCAKEGYKQLVFGLDTKVLPNWILSLSAGNALFSHTLSATGSNSVAINTESDDFIKQLPSVARERNVLCSVIVKALAKKIASLVSINAPNIKDGSLVADLGLDSLVTIQLRNWIRATFEAFLQPGDIVKAGTVGSLAGLVYDGSEVVKRLVSCDKDVEAKGVLSQNQR